MGWQDRLIEAIGRKNIFSLDINPVSIKKKKKKKGIATTEKKKILLQMWLVICTEQPANLTQNHSGIHPPHIY